MSDPRERKTVAVRTLRDADLLDEYDRERAHDKALVMMQQFAVAAMTRPPEATPTLTLRLAELEEEAIVRAVLDDEPTREITPCCQTCRVWGYSCCKVHGAKERAGR